MPTVTDHAGRPVTVELERCGHSTALERPVELAAVMGEFFARYGAVEPVGAGPSAP